MTTPKNAVEQARAAGYTSIKTFMGDLSLTDWLEMTSLKEIEYKDGNFYTPWLPSILERGKMERGVFTLQ